MENRDKIEQEPKSVDFSVLNDVLALIQSPNDLVIHIPTAFASSPMVPPDYQVTQYVPRQLQSHTDSTLH